jgi:hypothetical protein
MNALQVIAACLIALAIHAALTVQT